MNLQYRYSSIASGIVSGMSEKVRENRLRKAAGRQGLLLVKSRVRDPRGTYFGMFALVDTLNDRGRFRGDYTLSLDAVETQLTSAGATRRV